MSKTLEKKVEEEEETDKSQTPNRVNKIKETTTTDKITRKGEMGEATDTIFKMEITEIITGIMKMGNLVMREAAIEEEVGEDITIIRGDKIIARVNKGKEVAFITTIGIFNIKTGTSGDRETTMDKYGLEEIITIISREIKTGIIKIIIKVTIKSTIKAGKKHKIYCRSRKSFQEEESVGHKLEFT
jgi:hypothetical protein